MLEPHTARGVVYFEPYEVDLCVGDVLRYGHRIRLQDQPFRVLQILLERPSSVVTREQLQKKMWPSDTFLDFDRGPKDAVKRPREVRIDPQSYPNGRFARLHDPEGNPIELWQPAKPAASR